MSDTFRKVFPYYINAGMTYEQFWQGDPELVIYYRRAYEDRKEYDATMAYLQGRYFYDAMCLVSPLYNPLKPKKPRKYLKQPYAITPRMKEKQEQAEIREMVAGFNKMIDQYEADTPDGEEDAGTESAN